jgi:hypothetical protein
MKIKSLFFYVDFFPELRSLTHIQRGNLFLALIRCVKGDESAAAELDPVCALLFRMKVKSINRISEARAINGAKGGRGNKRNKFVPGTNPVAADSEVVNYNLDEFLIGDDSDDSAKSTGNKAKVLLTAVQREQLSAEFGESKLSQAITAVERWVARKELRNEAINIRDWGKTIREAVNGEWGASPFAANANKKHHYRALLKGIPSTEAYDEKL